MAAQLENCHAFLLGLGKDSPRFVELYGVDGTRVPSESELQIMRDTFQEGRDNHRVLANRLKSIQETIACTRSLHLGYAASAACGSSP